MSLTLKENTTTFLPAPEGLPIARCYALIDLGKQLNRLLSKEASFELMLRCNFRSHPHLPHVNCGALSNCALPKFKIGCLERSPTYKIMN